MKLEYRLKNNMLNLLNTLLDKDIDEETKKSYFFFNIELSKKVLKKNESYKNRTITIYNLYRQEDEIINSLIVGLAHHLDWCIRGETSNKSKNFIELYTNLLFQALDIGMMDYQSIIKSKDYENSNILQNVLSIYFSKEDLEKTCILECSSCFEIKDYLKKNGFHYNTIHQTWEREVETVKVKNITEYLKNKCKDIVISTRHINKICFGLNAKIFISGNTFKFREILKNNRYYYSNKKWYKNIRANEFLKEKANIEKLLPAGQGLKIDIEY